MATPQIARSMTVRRTPRPPGWPQLDERALHGLPGEIVRTLSPHTEADPVALLVDALVSIGSAIGPGPHFMVGGTEHRANENVCLVGDTAKARKGTSNAETLATFVAFFVGVELAGSRSTAGRTSATSTSLPRRSAATTAAIYGLSASMISTRSVDPG